jgi:hypothetical protein
MHASITRLTRSSAQWFEEALIYQIYPLGSPGGKEGQGGGFFGNVSKSQMQTCIHAPTCRMSMHAPVRWLHAQAARCIFGYRCHHQLCLDTFQASLQSSFDARKSCTIIIVIFEKHSSDQAEAMCVIVFVDHPACIPLLVHLKAGKH